MARASRGGKTAAGGGLLARLRRASGLLLSRDVAVLTNAIAFNFLLCLFPLLVVLLAVAQRLAPAGGAGAAVRLLLTELVPFGGETMADSLRQMSRLARGLELASLGLVVWGSSGIFIPVEMVLNHVVGGAPPRSFWRSRLLAFLLTAAGGALALLSVGFTLLARAFDRDWPVLAGYGVKAAAVLLTWALFTLVYRLAPAVRVTLRDAARGALWAAILWEASKYAFVWNLGRIRLATVYGPLSFAVALVLWAYLSSLMLVFGATMMPSGARRG